jgi:hypothetical protein
MSDSIHPHPMSTPPTSTLSSWSPAIVAGEETRGSNRFFRWWYRYTTPGEPAANASFVKREEARKAHLLSLVAFFFLATMVLFIPATLIMPISTFYLDMIIIAITVGALFINRTGNTTVAGIIIVATFEIALALGIVLITPLNETELQLYDLFIISELLAVSLLPVRSVFIIAVLNSAFVYIDLMVHKHTAVLSIDLQTQFIPVLARPVGLQLIIAGVVFLWVNSATQAIGRANKAEMVAMLEHTIAEQGMQIEKEKQALEESIQQIVQAHVNATNGQLITRIPYPPAKVLWPLVGVVNALWIRLKHSQQNEIELQQLKQAISVYTALVYRASISSQQPLSIQRTGTALDPLILSISKLQPITQNKG